MRVALISDLHGNALALSAVLSHIEQQGVDELVCLGDVATLGPHPGEVIELLRDRGCACILGNHDEFLFAPELVSTYTRAAVVQQAIDWSRAQLTTAQLAFVEAFVERVEIQLDVHNRLLLFHGSPASNQQDLLATTPADELDHLLGGERAQVMAGGHTHIQMLRQHQGSLLVNPGSVGMPFKEYVHGEAPELLPCAEYALVEAHAGSVEVRLVRVPLQPAALHAAAASAPENPLATFLKEQYR